MAPDRKCACTQSLFLVLGGGALPKPSTGTATIRHVAAVICRENSRMICSATRMRPAGSRVVARGRSPGERA
eukprot:scaffold10191_cov108-Isochrysis_galbana.AAC.2